ncbi:MAG: hypothetical protein IPP72_10955 [Chitinophagaceae bacterium]|nr:hypothetical protein [Chitinophagaceae bacterium]
MAEVKIKEEITTNEKGWAGFLLIFFTVIPAFFIIALWPDRMPDPDHKLNVSYHFQLFHVRLITDSQNKTTGKTVTADTLKKKPVTDTSGTTAVNLSASDSAVKKTIESLADSVTADAKKATEKDVAGACSKNDDPCCLININTILLLLVALAGFLGNMIHISTSFTTYVGAEQFKRSWVLWYYVKPFSASALAVGLYFVFRGGFLSMNNDPANINLYGVMTLSLLAGLFTDKATLKLKEIFEVVFRSKEERPDTLTPKAKVKGITPLVIDAGIENTLTLTGENLDVKIKATINDEIVPITDKAKETATIKYSIPATQKDKTEFVLLIKDEDGNTLLREILKLKAVPATLPAGEGGEEEAETTITVEPLEIEKEKENTITVTGENIKAGIKATINNAPVTITQIADNTATIKYRIPETEAGKTEFILNINDAEGNPLFAASIKLKST